MRNPEESLGCTHRNPQIRPKAEKQKARGRGGSLTAKLIEMPGGCSSLRGRGSSLRGGGGERLPAVLGGGGREGDVLSSASGAEGAEYAMPPERGGEATQGQAWFSPEPDSASQSREGKTSSS